MAEAKGREGRPRMGASSNTSHRTPAGENLGPHSPTPADAKTRGERDNNIMAIRYSLTVKPIDPANHQKGNKTFATAQYANIMELHDIAGHMSSHDSKYNKGDVMAVLTQMATCLREQLLLGNKVNLGDLGSFFIVLHGEGAENAENFNPAMINKVTVRWTPGTAFTNMRTEAQFQFVGTRKSQSEARKSERDRLNALASEKPGTEDPGTGNTGGGGGLGD